MNRKNVEAAAQKTKDTELEEEIYLEDRRLPEGAAQIRNKFTAQQRKQIKEVDTMTYTDVMQQRWKGFPDDIDVAIMIAAVEKSGASESAVQQLLSNMDARWPFYGKVWLRHMRKAVVSIMSEDKRRTEKGTHKNVVGQDGFDDLVRFGLKQLQQSSRVMPDLFRYGSEIAEIETIEEAGTTSIRTIDRLTFKARLNTVAPYRTQVGDNGYRSEEVPPGVANQIYAEKDIPLPYLAGKVTAPVFRPSGGLLSVSGYDRETNLYYQPPESLANLSVPENVAGSDVEWAREQMVDLLCDFEMDGVSRQQLEAAALNGEGEVPPSFLAAVGWMMEQSVRPMLGAEPLMPLLVSKTAPGAGGGLLVKAMQLVIEGKTSSRPLAKSEDEIRKAAFTALLGGHMTIFWDNLPAGKAVDSPVLASLSTEPTFTDRVLGRSQERHVPVRSSLVFVGNRPLFSDELRRRLMLIELVPQVANPEERTGWKHPNLMRHVAAHRADYLRAVLILVKNWIQKGKPRPVHAPTVGSYEAYSEIIPGILEAASANWMTWAQNRNKLNEVASNDEEDEMSGLLDFWADAFGIGKKVEVSEILEAAKLDEVVLQIGKKRNAVSDFDYCGRAMGGLLKSMNGRIFPLQDGTSVTVKKHTKRGNNGSPWFLEQVDERKQETAAAKPQRRASPPMAAPVETVSQEPAKPAPQKTREVINRRKRADWVKPKQDSIFDQFGQHTDSPFGK
ncbi:hypothetical protein [Shimia thalassica]|uniref:hypothetical protein n=1 Tax=Shimia thalassica TaxID=1715693 RepID=UPI0026E2C8DD|nr:hypothetical protein [Shimia thalassica]MDO6480961.1 hypothetical protein [Shimia thalassica]